MCAVFNGIVWIQIDYTSLTWLKFNWEYIKHVDIVLHVKHDTAPFRSAEYESLHTHFVIVAVDCVDVDL